jgi:hypothetical protein
MGGGGNTLHNTIDTQGMTINSYSIGERVINKRDLKVLFSSPSENIL